MVFVFQTNWILHGIKNICTHNNGSSNSTEKEQKKNESAALNRK